MTIFRFLLVLLSALFIHQAAFAQEYRTEQTQFMLREMASGLNHPWAIDFLPDGRAIITERDGVMRIMQIDGTLSPPLENVPDVFSAGQGGLLDVMVAPDFNRSHLIYYTYAEAGEGGTAGTAVGRARLGRGALLHPEVIFRQQPKVKGNSHFGSRLAFDNDGFVYIGLGERFDFAKQAQKLDNHLGKVIRVHADGTTPQSNPFLEDPEALPEIWSYGHRNIQGMATHPTTGEIWLHEHGPRGGDEINITKFGGNYGWPEASYGSHYTYFPIPDEHKEQGFDEPLYYWTPSIAPSGMMFYTGNLFPQWKGNLFIGALAKTHLVRLELNGRTITHEEKLLENLEERIRDVAQSPDGAIYLLTDSDNGKVLRLHPSN